MRFLLGRRFCSTFSHDSDYHKIMNTLNTFLWCIDHNDPQTFASLFSSDGKVEVVKTKGIFDTPEKLKKLCTGIHAQFSPALHFESNFVIDIAQAQAQAQPQAQPHSQPKTAKNKSYWYSMLGGEIISSGYHYDDLIFQDNRWLIQNRVTKHHWSKSGGFEHQ